MDGKLVAHATAFGPLEQFFPDAAALLGKDGVGMLRIESEADLASIQLARHRRSGAWSAANVPPGRVPNPAVPRARQRSIGSVASLVPGIDSVVTIVAPPTNEPPSTPRAVISAGPTKLGPATNVSVAGVGNAVVAYGIASRTRGDAPSSRASRHTASVAVLRASVTRRARSEPEHASKAAHARTPSTDFVPART